MGMMQFFQRMVLPINAKKLDNTIGNLYLLFFFQQFAIRYLHLYLIATVLNLQRSLIRIVTRLPDNIPCMRQIRILMFPEKSSTLNKKKTTKDKLKLLKKLCDIPYLFLRNF